jgi:hypothetical protein
MKRSHALAGLALAAAITAALPASAVPVGVPGNGNGGGNGGGGDKSHGKSEAACTDDGKVEWTPTSVWPPNHKYKTINITFIDDDNDGDTITVSVDSASHNQITDGVESLGSGNTDNDAVPGPPGSATDPDDAKTSAQIRAERSGLDQNGRNYDLVVTCTDTGDESGDDEESETITITVNVPHDRGRNPA